MCDFWERLQGGVLLDRKTDPKDLEKKKSFVHLATPGLCAQE